MYPPAMDPIKKTASWKQRFRISLWGLRLNKKRKKNKKKKTKTESEVEEIMWPHSENLYLIPQI